MTRTKPQPIDEFTRDEAIVIMCRALATHLELHGDDGDAVAVRLAENVLLSERHGFIAEIDRLKAENRRLRRQLRGINPVAAASPTEGVQS